MPLRPPDRLVRCALALALLVASSAARADLVSDWLWNTQRALTGASQWARFEAEIQARIAIFNALNAITPRYEPVGTGPVAAPLVDSRAAPEAAVAAAARAIVAVAPGSDRALIDSRYEEALRKVADREARERGITLGRRAAYSVLLARAADHGDRVEPSTRPTGPGVFEVPAGASRASSITMMRMPPFTLKEIPGFDPGPPPAPTSARAAAERAEARLLGAANSTSRTADQTAAAIFWYSALGSIPDLLIARIADARKPDPLDHARMHALWAIASYDAQIVDVAIKDRYRHWRPENAIRGSHADPAVRDPSWEPLMATPTSPEWVSGAAIQAGMQEVIFESLAGGAKVDWTIVIPETYQRRSWPTLQAMADEAVASRIWAGSHYRSSVEAGRALGRQLGERILQSALRPLSRQ